jgi:hypothetical protein
MSAKKLAHKINSLFWLGFLTKKPLRLPERLFVVRAVIIR